MVLIRIFIYVLVLYAESEELQINLDLTTVRRENDAFEHDCLRIPTRIVARLDFYQIISYCMSEWRIENNNRQEHQVWTFAELDRYGVTSEDLYHWSASMDIAEDYQLYLDQRTSSEQIFYNCTSPYFGSSCQYTLDIPLLDHSSLNDLIDSFYEQLYEPSQMTCYVHLECNRGSIFACLDWTDICDGKIDCLNDGIDEKHCWKLQINQCTDDEYRCNNGQCIEKTFANDEIDDFECMDQSDEKYPIFYHNNIYASAPTFQYEDIQCLGDGYSPMIFTSSCVRQRHQLFFEAMFADRSNRCLFAFQCYFQILERRENQRCRQIIDKFCPDMFSVPHAPIFFGHIYLLYTKNDVVQSNTQMQLPSYICYDERLCKIFSPNKTILVWKNSTCRRPEDFPLEFAEFPGDSWVNTYFQPIFQQLFKCNTILYRPSIVCNRSIMYQCLHSSKCISHHRIGDGLIDCDHGDDEIENIIYEICIEFQPRTLFQCTRTKKCIHQRFVENGICECGCHDDDVCEDEAIELNQLRRQISFQSICDSISEFYPIEINGRNETDETECDIWPCNNARTHCNGIWNCLDGADEVDCYSSLSFPCPPRHHICISIVTKQPICLPIEQASDGKIDCLEGADEPNQCQVDDESHMFDNIDCQNYTSLRGIRCTQVCFDNLMCTEDDSEQFCLKMHRFTQYDYICNEPWMHGEKSINRISSLTQQRFEQRCHRGIPLRVWIDRAKNTTITTCLCPPSFYGSTCQYQNERVTLTLVFQVNPDSFRTVFAIIISLIDDSDEQTIHSSEQFSYLYIRDCERKFKIYLTYATRPKNPTKSYYVQIDIYEKISLTYRTSFLLPLKFPFLPVQRLAVRRTIPHANENRPQCRQTFCHCRPGWSGKYCHIPYSCTCAPDSLCLGRTASNRSICVCPVDRFGARCYLRQTVCYTNSNDTCQNGGTCVSADEYTSPYMKFFCICPKGYTGSKCEISNTQIIISFEQSIAPLSRSMIVHFVITSTYDLPSIGRTSQTISIYQKTVTMYWSEDFNLALLEMSNKELYMVTNPYTYNRSAVIEVTIHSSDRCKYINEVLNETIVNLHLIRRIKYYHVPCQVSSLPCFYDDQHFCTCYSFGHQRLADCFEVNLGKRLDCFGNNYCENDAQCLQDKEFCPTSSECVCPSCFYGTRCQFSSNLFGLSLDAILGYHIQPHVSIRQQPPIVKFSIAITVIITIAGLSNGILSLLTFKNQEPQDVGCDLYLLGSSIIILLTTVIFALKFWILLAAQMIYHLNRTFLTLQCISLDFLLQIGLNLDQWLNACVAIERAITTLKGIRFNKQKSKKIAKYTISLLLILTISTTLHNPIHRKLIHDGHDYEEKRIWCVVTYPSGLQIYNSTINIFHFLMPFVIHLLSALTIIKKITRLRNRVSPQQNYRQTLQVQIGRHSRILIAPLIFIILTTPRLILSLVSGCMKSIDDAWIFLFGYYISFLPLVSTFIVFVLPSKTYKKKFWKTTRQFRILLRTLLRLNLS